MLYIDIKYQLDPEEKYELETNIKEDQIVEVLSEYVRSQIGAGEDSREPNRHKEFNIRIELDLADDTFSTESNTGNKGLTTGLVMAVLVGERKKIAG